VGFGSVGRIGSMRLCDPMYAGKKSMKNDFFIGMVSKNETF
jgi:hypothetical protein